MSSITKLRVLHVWWKCRWTSWVVALSGGGRGQGNTLEFWNTLRVKGPVLRWHSRPRFLGPLVLRGRSLTYKVLNVYSCCREFTFDRILIQFEYYINYHWKNDVLKFLSFTMVFIDNNVHPKTLESSCVCWMYHPRLDLYSSFKNTDLTVS